MTMPALSKVGSFRALPLSAYPLSMGIVACAHPKIGYDRTPLAPCGKSHDRGAHMLKSQECRRFARVAAQPERAFISSTRDRLIAHFLKGMTRPCRISGGSRPRRWFFEHAF
jgi:hypothetical protein